MTPSSLLSLIETRRRAQLERLRQPIILERLGGARAFLFQSISSSFVPLSPTPPSSSQDASFLWEPDVIQPPKPRSLRVCCVGLANSGKSSLVNRLLRTKLSAVSPKRNTTRTSLMGVRTRASTQLVVHDTPGLLIDHSSRAYEQELTADALHTVQQMDVVLLVVDAAKRLGEQERRLCERMSAIKRQHPHLLYVLVLNKVDLVHPKLKLLDLAEQLVAMCPEIRDVFYLSLVAEEEHESGVGEFEEYLFQRALPREWDWTEATVSELSPLERVAEVIREKIFLRVHEEVPYQVQQTNSSFTRIDARTVRIDQQIRVHSDSHKSILIGSKGATLQWIQREAAKDIAEVLGVERVLLYLQVHKGQKSDANLEQGIVAESEEI